MDVLKTVVLSHFRQTIPDTIFIRLFEKTGRIIVFPLAGGWAGVLVFGRAASNFCLEHISCTFGGILMKLHTNVHHYEKPCCVHEPSL
jgi:hypothetical protein